MKNKYITLGALVISLLYVDLFCGAGGTSTGVESAKVHNEKCAKVIACVNHDANAIASHAFNHPDTLHFTEDIRTLNVNKDSELVKHIAEMRKKHPFAKVVLWASLECTNHSKAKGGMSRDADSRTLAEHLFRYIEAINPDSIQIENVEEFLIWGPLIPKVVEKDGTSYCPLTPLMKPIWIPDPERKSEYYNKWVDKVKKYYYNYDYRILNSADFGALTSRKRFFAQFNKSEFPIVWPEPTHAKNPVSGLFESLEKWRPVKEVLDFDDEGVSIFGRKKPLVEASLERIWHGLIKFVAGGKDKWLLKYNSINKETRKHIPPSIEEPCPVISTQGRLGIITSKFLSAYYGNGFTSSVDEPSPTVTTGDRFSLISSTFIDQQFGKSKPAGINTVLGCITTNPKYAKISTFIMNQYSGGGQSSHINKPAPAILATPKQNLITCEKWVLNTNFKNTGSSIDQPAPTVTANRKWHYLMDAQYSRVGNDVEQPCFTLIARMDKTPPYLIEITQSGKIPSFIKIDGNVVIYEIYEDDTPMMKKIKEFMALYGLLDIKMRMLKIQELKEIMGFPADYKLIGTQAEQKKFIGNAVEVTMARKICEASANKLLEIRKVA